MGSAGSTFGSMSIRTNCPGSGLADLRQFRQKPSFNSVLLVLVSFLPQRPQVVNSPPLNYDRWFVHGFTQALISASMMAVISLWMG